MLFQEPAVHCTELWKKPGESCGMEKIEEIESSREITKQKGKAFGNTGQICFPRKAKSVVLKKCPCAVLSEG